MVPQWSLVVVIVLCLPFVIQYLYNLVKNKKTKTYNIAFDERQDGLLEVTIEVCNNELSELYLHMNDGTINKVVRRHEDKPDGKPSSS